MYTIDPGFSSFGRPTAADVRTRCSETTSNAAAFRIFSAADWISDMNWLTPNGADMTKEPSVQAMRSTKHRFHQRSSLDSLKGPFVPLRDRIRKLFRASPLSRVELTSTATAQEPSNPERRIKYGAVPENVSF